MSVATLVSRGPAGAPVPDRGDDPPVATAPRTGRWRPLLHPVGWFLVSRLAVLVVAAVAIAVHPGLSASRLVSAWDSHYYLDILEHGYPAVVPELAGRATVSPLAFFPLFPLLAGAVAWILHIPNAAATMVVSLAFGAGATVLFSRLAAELTDERTARRVTVLFCLFPGSVVFSIGYSESLMITLAAACLLALLRERWVLAGLCAALATATRPNAVALVLACAWAAGVAVRRQRDWRALAAPLLAPAGVVAFFAYLWWHTGEPAVWFRVQREGWDQSFDFGLNTVRMLNNFILDPFADGRRLVTMVLLGFTLVSGAVFLARRRPGVVTIYTLAVLALAVGSTIDIVRPRAILTAFPLFIGWAASAGRRTYAALAACFAIGLGTLVLFPLWVSP
jgi:hypothetical protein